MYLKNRSEYQWNKYNIFSMNMIGFCIGLITIKGLDNNVKNKD